jgi:tRNA(fMet)-specific endonuclease VapC
MLDTNIASIGLKGMFQYWINRHNTAYEEICISVLTKAEIIYGIHKNRSSKLENLAVNLFSQIEILPWDEVAAETYGELRNDMRKQGLSLARIDMLIAAHAKSRDLTLVTNDQAFYQAKHLLQLADWSQA